MRKRDEEREREAIREGQMETEYHKPPGYDRARGKEVEEEKSC